jgi:ribosomal protein L24E
MDQYVFLIIELESMYIHRSSTVLLHCNNKCGHPALYGCKKHGIYFLRL